MGKQREHKCILHSTQSSLNWYSVDNVSLKFQICLIVFHRIQILIFYYDSLIDTLLKSRYVLSFSSIFSMILTNLYRLRKPSILGLSSKNIREMLPHLAYQIAV